MVFSSAVFLYLFLPVVLGVYFLLPRSSSTTMRNTWLLVASYGFYAWGNWMYLPLLLGSTLVDFYCARRIDSDRSQKQRKAFLWISILANIGVLFWFKYLGLFATSYQYLIGGIDASLLMWASSIALPVGISFYTFQSMSYTIDVYRREVKSSHNFLNFATYVALFPQLVAGPIVRYKEISKELVERRESSKMIALGIGIFVLGLSKKVLLANPCGWVADQAFDASVLDAATAWVGLLAYGMQIYFDFSGYSEMAIGLGAMFGFKFPRNFNAPYLASSVTDFWRRWHITLGAWLRDYVYIPLGGSRAGMVRTVLSLMAVMLIAGLWHGAMWGFVIWGGLHGVMLVVERLLGCDGDAQGKLGRVFRILFTFVIVQLLWVFFRADSVDLALQYYAALFDFSYLGSSASSLLVMRSEVFVLLGISLCVVLLGGSARVCLLKRSVVSSCVVIALFLLCLAMLSEQSHNPFIYFRF